jgi:hypothetical protein
MSREDDELRELWKQEEPRMDITVEEVAARAAKFQRTIKWRNVREYAAAAFMIVWMAWSMKDPMPILVRIGSVLLAAGVVFVVVTLRRRGRAAHQDAGAAPTSQVLRSLVAELRRQRDLLRDVPRWYLAPFVPGFLLIAIGRFLEQPEKWPVQVRFLLSTAAIFAFVAWLNRRAARNLDKEIAKLTEP